MREWGLLFHRAAPSPGFIEEETGSLQLLSGSPTGTAYPVQPERRPAGLWTVLSPTLRSSLLTGPQAHLSFELSLHVSLACKQTGGLAPASSEARPWAREEKQTISGGPHPDQLTRCSWPLFPLSCCLLGRLR